MADQWIVQSSALLGPPNTDRVFRQGEVVTADDFERCKPMIQTLLDRGSLKIATADTLPAAEALRGKYDRDSIGAGPEVPKASVIQLLKDRRAIFDGEAPKPKEEPKPAPPAVEPAPVVHTVADVTAPPVAVVKVQDEAPRASRKKDD